ncbi:MAG: LysM peptidoglycan-binding domain-containing protein [Chthoniobacteraceae bacterium]
MISRILVFTLTIFLLPHGLRAASSAATEKEYQQVRTIALRDARVQSAYRDADRRLDAKIVQIDPALESYVKSRQAAREGAPAPKAASKPVPTKPFTAAKPAGKPTPRPAPAKPSGAGSATHVVASGETLGGIAVKHHVSISALKAANHIVDERKLRIGQVLAIPSGKAAPAVKKSDSIWSLRSN